MILDFLEIGTSNFRTLIETASDTTVGISVEPISHYINQLPDKKNVIKENVAIAFDDTEQDIEIFYIPENVIIDNNFPNWLKGCNSLNKFHAKHIELNIENYVTREIVKQIPISNLIKNHNITEIKLLKIDTEGGDCDILLNLEKVLLHSNTKALYPKKIVFETNILTPKDKLSTVLSNYDRLGYKIEKQTKTDTILVIEEYQ